MLLGVKENLGYIIGFEILLGISTGFNFQGPMMSALVNASKTPGSSILTTAYMNFGRSMTTALFSEIGSAIYASSLKSGIVKIAPQLQETEYPIEQVMLQTELIKQLDGHDRALVFGKMMTAFYNVFWMCVGMSLVSLVFAVFMSKKKIPKGEDVEA
ncbi:DEKNAAC101207 [Brettanomyces naardenensis]|uniref:DEKNAAC101207 n=1 Tax=Brettanomyces naardenensis TaxID=13370 RepID=A0A448YHE7_BRENA|nr:DEKNAAC101207 [Brettanomyces naardenensis]